MPFMLAMVMLFSGIVYIISNYIKEQIFWKIFWEFYAFDTWYISQENIELPKNCCLPLYLKKTCGIAAREEKYQWVPVDELVPTGNIMIGNKGMEWYEVVWNSSKEYVPAVAFGYIPVAIVKMARIIPWRLIERAYQ